MSTRVLPVGGFFNFNRMSEFRRRVEPPNSSQSDDQSDNSSLQSRNVCRNLFGPIDHDENVKFVQEELTKIAAADRRRWNFDFQNDKPLDGRYSWESTQGGHVPVAYNMPNLTAKLTLPNTYPSTSKVTISVPSSASNSATSSRTKNENEDSSVNPLRSSITTVTTATTTVMSVCPKISKEISLETSKSTSQQPNIENNTYQSQVQPSSTQQQMKKVSIKNTKQPKMTELLKIRKRSHSNDTKIEAEDTALPAPKRAKTSS